MGRQLAAPDLSSSEIVELADLLELSEEDLVSEERTAITRLAPKRRGWVAFVAVAFLVAGGAGGFFVATARAVATASHAAPQITLALLGAPATAPKPPTTSEPRSEPAPVAPSIRPAGAKATTAWHAVPQAVAAVAPAASPSPIVHALPTTRAAPLTKEQAELANAQEAQALANAQLASALR